jgi:thiol-disulfide isomerase/thioredoxin
MQFLCALCLIAGLSLTAQASLPTFQRLDVGSTTYTNVSVLSYNSTDVYFRHAQGVANVKIKYLKPDIQKLLEYDPKTADKVEEQRSREEKEAARTLAATAPSAPAPASRTDERSVADPVGSASLLKKAAPEIAVDKWIGQPPAFAGKVRLIHLWEPWSVPCRKWLPTYSRLHQTHADRLTIAAVSSSSEAEILPHLEQLGSVGLDKNGSLAARLGVTSVPHAVVVDAKGLVRYNGHPGGITEEFLQALMGENH